MADVREALRELIEGIDNDPFPVPELEQWNRYFTALTKARAALAENTAAPQVAAAAFISWRGFNVGGNRESITEVRRLVGCGDAWAAHLNAHPRGPLPNVYYDLNNATEHAAVQREDARSDEQELIPAPDLTKDPPCLFTAEPKSQPESAQQAGWKVVDNVWTIDPNVPLGVIEFWVYGNLVGTAQEWPGLCAARAALGDKT